MPTIQPAAVVRPRVCTSESGEVQLLEDVVSDYRNAMTDGILWLTGPPGSGKSMALDYLATYFDDLLLLDDVDPKAARSESKSRLIVAVHHPGTVRPRHGIGLSLLPWSRDDLLEYLLQAHPGACKTVMTRLAADANKPWLPTIARVVLDQMATDQRIENPHQAIVAEVRGHLPSTKLRLRAGRFAGQQLLGHYEKRNLWRRNTFLQSLSAATRQLLEQREVQIALASEYLAAVDRPTLLAKAIAKQLPIDLMESAAWIAKSNEDLRERLQLVMDSPRLANGHSMAASLLVKADSNWQPPTYKTFWNFAGAELTAADWTGIDLTKATLSKATVAGASLRRSTLRKVGARVTRFDHADLSESDLTEIKAEGASFVGANLANIHATSAELTGVDFSYANLEKANLTRAQLNHAVLVEADLTDSVLHDTRLINAKFDHTNLTNASLVRANLSSADLRSCILHQADFSHAILMQANLEDVYLPDTEFAYANLSQSNLTGSEFPNARFEGCWLTGAHLAEIQWENANLRRADLSSVSFHMGSSRSGLVGSPIAMEGSMTGFYTNDREELYFKKPEQIRKANLRGADLRGAIVENVDFYLVDLRGALLDPGQEAQARQTGAILEDFGDV